MANIQRAAASVAEVTQIVKWCKKHYKRRRQWNEYYRWLILGELLYGATYELKKYTKEQAANGIEAKQPEQLLFPYRQICHPAIFG